MTRAFKRRIILFCISEFLVAFFRTIKLGTKRWLKDDYTMCYIFTSKAKLAQSPKKNASRNRKTVNLYAQHCPCYSGTRSCVSDDIFTTSNEIRGTECYHFLLRFLSALSASATFG